MEDLDKIEARYPDNDPIDNDVRALIAELRQTRLQNGEAQKLLGRAKAMIYEAFAEALIVGGGHDVLVQGKEGELLTEIDTYLKGVEKPKCDYTESGELVVCGKPMPCPDHWTKEEADKIIDEAGFASGVKPVAEKRKDEPPKPWTKEHCQREGHCRYPFEATCGCKCAKCV